MIPRATSLAFAERLDHYRRRVDQKLADVLGADNGVPDRLLDAMRYSVLGGGSDELAARPQAQIKMLAWLTRAAGPAGMVGGQALDMAAEGQRIDERGLERIHRGKTGALIRASIMMPSELGDLSGEQRANLDVFARDIGLVFQIRDDLLEVEQDTATLGKNAGSESGTDTATDPSSLGVEGARRRAAETQQRAVGALRALGAGSDALLWLSEFILNRSY